MTGESGIKVVATNPRVLHDYELEDRFEAGISLLGSEVKALREGRANLRDSFARIEGEQAFLYQCHISPYSHAAPTAHDPNRTRKLLLHRDEIRRLLGRTTLRGWTLVPLRIYFKKGRAKVELALGRGKQRGDQREAIREREARREIDRAMRSKT